jgi:hypothetical protein
MIRRSTWIILFVFILLLGSLLVYQRVQENKPVDETSDILSDIGTLEPVKLLFPVPEGEVILGLHIEDTSGNVMDIKRQDESQEWKLNNPIGEADQDAISRVINQLISMSIDSTLDPSTDKQVLGLDAPVYTLRLLVSNGGSFILYIGDVTITNSSYYAQMAGDSPIVVNKYSLDSAINLLTTPPILDTPTPEPTENGG